MGGNKSSRPPTVASPTRVISRTWRNRAGALGKPNGGQMDRWRCSRAAPPSERLTRAHCPATTRSERRGRRAPACESELRGAAGAATVPPGPGQPARRRRSGRREAGMRVEQLPRALKRRHSAEREARVWSSRPARGSSRPRSASRLSIQRKEGSRAVTADDNGDTTRTERSSRTSGAVQSLQGRGRAAAPGGGGGPRQSAPRFTGGPIS